MLILCGRTFFPLVTLSPMKSIASGDHLFQPYVRVLPLISHISSGLLRFWRHYFSLLLQVHLAFHLFQRKVLRERIIPLDLMLV